MRYAQFWSVIAVASISTGVAAAEDNLKGTYAFTGTQVCLTAPAGFKEDSKGNLAIPMATAPFRWSASRVRLSTMPMEPVSSRGGL
jgi:hypothetical protein